MATETELSIYWINNTKCNVESNHHSKYPGQNTDILYVCMFIMYVCMYIYVCMCISVCVCIYMYDFLCVYVHVCVCVCMYMYM